MNKVLGLVVASVLAFAGTSANAQLLQNLQTHGELEVHGVWASNMATYRNSDRGRSSWRNTQTRLTFGLTFDLLDDVHSTVTFVKNDRFWGDHAAVGQKFQGQALADLENTIRVQEANVQIDDVFGIFSAKIGRQFYGEEGSYIIYFGKRHLVEGLLDQSLDAAVVTYTHEIAGKTTNFEFMYAKPLNSVNAITPNQLLGDVDETIWGIRAYADLTENFRTSLAAYNNRTGRNYEITGTNPDNLWLVNLGFAGNLGGFLWNIDGALNLGSNGFGDNYKGYAYMINVAYPIAMNTMTLTPRVGFAYGSGDKDTAMGNTTFRGINSDFRPGYIFSSPTNEYPNGAYEPFSLSNLSVLSIGFDLQISEKSTFMVDAYAFRHNRTVAGAYDGNKSIGQEVDLTFNYAYSENIDFGLYAAKFFTGGVIRADKSGTVGATGGTGLGGSTKAGSYLSIRW